MAVKTITIDIEAYERLKSVQQPEESFSQTIKRVVKKPVNIDAVLDRLRKIQLSDETVSAIEEQIEQRHLPSTRES